MCEKLKWRYVGNVMRWNVMPCFLISKKKTMSFFVKTYSVDAYVRYQ